MFHVSNFVPHGIPCYGSIAISYSTRPDAESDVLSRYRIFFEIIEFRCTRPTIDFCFRSKELFLVGQVGTVDILWLHRPIVSQLDKMGGTSRQTFEQNTRIAVYCHRARSNIQPNVSSTSKPDDTKDNDHQTKQREYAFDRENTLEPRRTG
eukprot:703217_1